MLVFERDDGFEMGPAKSCNECVHNLKAKEDLGKADHVEEQGPYTRDPCLEKSAQRERILKRQDAKDGRETQL